MMLGNAGGIKQTGGRRGAGRARTLRAAFASAAFAALAAGCGFQLAGTGNLPPAMQTTYIDSTEPRSEFYTSLAETLRRRGLDVVDSGAAAGARLVITEDLSGERVLSVSARNIPREYEIFYSIIFSLEADGESLIDAETLVVRRNYSFDETQVLGKEREEALLRRALAEDLARQVMRRIEAVTAGRARAPG